MYKHISRKIGVIESFDSCICSYPVGKILDCSCWISRNHELQIRSLDTYHNVCLWQSTTKSLLTSISYGTYLCEEEPLYTLLNSTTKLRSQCNQCQSHEKSGWKKEERKKNFLIEKRVMFEIMAAEKICLIFFFNLCWWSMQTYIAWIWV